MKKVEVKIKLDTGARIPLKKIETDACYDVYATSIRDLGDGRIEYGTGIHLTPKQFSQIDLRSRSSIHKTGLLLSNGIGTGDESYTGEYKAVFYNIIPSLPNYVVGDRILQMQVRNRSDIDFTQIGTLKSTERGDGGYGHTGNK